METWIAFFRWFSLGLLASGALLILYLNVLLYVIQRRRFVWGGLDIRREWMLKELLELRLEDIPERVLANVRYRRMHNRLMTQLFYSGCVLLTCGWVCTVIWWASGSFLGLLMLYLCTFVIAPLWDCLIFNILKIVTLIEKIIK